MKNSMDMIDYIRRRLPETELLAQLAEEAAELAQAALKLRRVLDGRNVTPVTEYEAWEALQEEIGDVQICLEVLNMNDDDDYTPAVKSGKLTRWVTRLGGRDNDN